MRKRRPPKAWVAYEIAKRAGAALGLWALHDSEPSSLERIGISHAVAIGGQHRIGQPKPTGLN